MITTTTTNLLLYKTIEYIFLDNQVLQVEDFASGSPTVGDPPTIGSSSTDKN